MWCQRMPQQMWRHSVSGVVLYFADVAALFENDTSRMAPPKESALAYELMTENIFVIITDEIEPTLGFAVPRTFTGSVGSVWLAFGGVSDNARVVVIVAAMRLFSQSGEDSFDDISMTLVLASFLGGFLVDEEALEAIFESGFRADYVRFLRM
ncbi:hypothetical protein Tco_0140932 [Tanacetum coccineum]